MAHVLVIGAGFAGCTAAAELAENGVKVTLIEISESLGGKVRTYGCKATDKCNNCGVCLSAGLWERVEQSKNIDIRFLSNVIDLIKSGSEYTAYIKDNEGGLSSIEGLSKVIAATGFEAASLATYNGFTELEAAENIITGSEIESLLLERTSQSLNPMFKSPPKSIAFIQCYGSRDYREHAMYCSKVCCAYTSRAAKVIKHLYPECRVVFFYMEMQMINPGNYYQSLVDIGIEFIKCRPVKISGGSPAHVFYDEPSTGSRLSLPFDLVVLSNGIKQGEAARQIAEVCGLSQDAAGFMYSPRADYASVQPIGCASAVKRIEDTYKEALSTAKEILSHECIDNR